MRDATGRWALLMLTWVTLALGVVITLSTTVGARAGWAVAYDYGGGPHSPASTGEARFGQPATVPPGGASIAASQGVSTGAPAVVVAAYSEGGILSRVKAAASGDRGAIGREPVIGGEAANYGDDELAQFAFQHSGQGYANGEVRPSLDEIQSTISNGVRSRLPNQNAIRIQTPSVRVTINEDQPWKSTAYYR